MGLERTPAAEVIQLTGAVWLEALTEGRKWDQELDTPRFRRAFQVLCRDRASWPPPHALLEAMPPREQLAITKQPNTSAPDDPKVRAKMDRIGAMLRSPA